MYFSSFDFKENHVFSEEDNSSQRFVIAEEELYDIDVDGIANWEDLRCSSMSVGILKKSIDGGKLTKNINQKKKPVVFYAYGCPLCEKCYRRQYFFNKHMEYSESLGKHDFS